MVSRIELCSSGWTTTALVPMFETKLRCRRHDKQCESVLESGSLLEPLASFAMKLAAWGAVSGWRTGW
jgi:hypothetical protein